MLTFNPTELNHVIYLGFFECEFNTESLKTYLKHQINDEIKLIKTKYPQIKQCEGPINGSFFNGSRFRSETENPYFVFETLHQKFYPNLFKTIGFSIKDRWYTYKLDSKNFHNHIVNQKNRFKHFWKDKNISTEKICNFNYIHDIYSITLEAFNFKDTNNDISFVLFESYVKKMKPLLNKKYSRILKYKNEVVGFNLSFNNDTKFLIKNRRLLLKQSFFHKILFLCKFFLYRMINKPALILMYVAKKNNCPVKWAMLLLASENQVNNKNRPPYLISAFNKKSSGSQATLTGRTLYSESFTMIMELENI